MASVARSAHGPVGRWLDPRSHQGFCALYEIYSHLVLSLGALFIQCLDLI
jgi:hypothetical protein